MKFKIQKTTLELTLQTKEVATNRVIFSFNEEFLNNGKLYVTGKELSSIDDLTETGSITRIYSDKTNIIISLGEKNKFDLDKYHRSLTALAKWLSHSKKVVDLDIILEPQLAKLLNFDVEYYTEQNIFHLINGLYYFDQFKSNRDSLSIKKINFVSADPAKQTLESAIILLNGIYLIKDLGNLPANIATPSYLAKTAENIAKLSKKVQINILGKKELKDLGMNSFLSVSHGTVEEPKFITLSYTGSKPKDKPIVLVGKGVTFDSGGISLKPSAKMDEMKYDMLGAATILGIFRTVVELNLPLNLVIAAACTENMPSGSATKPGDIVTTLSGKTVEILNTDAEGRLILADVLTYVERFNPKLVIDLATLTGACIIALGSVASGLYCNDETLCSTIKNSAKKTNDKVWEMPLFDEYEKGLKNSIADLSNISSLGNVAGSVVAAKFLANFVNYKWAHLDIAGTAHISGAYNGKTNGGATGRPFMLLIDFIRNYTLSSK
ncbi:MAG: leucyl aminopeptidase [Burkholderiales bacterium]|nr:leucyl aminopeptidase [Burkholderiales bacterium]